MGNEENPAQDQLQRVRAICSTLARSWEKLSHGAPTFFVDKNVFTMFVNHHHLDGHLAVWLPVPPGEQQLLVMTSPQVFFVPPYVGVKGWVGIELLAIDEDDLSFYLRQAWQMIGAKQRRGHRINN